MYIQIERFGESAHVVQRLRSPMSCVWSWRLRKTSAIILSLKVWEPGKPMA